MDFIHFLTKYWVIILLLVSVYYSYKAKKLKKEYLAKMAANGIEKFCLNCKWNYEAEEFNKDLFNTFRKNKFYEICDKCNEGSEFIKAENLKAN